MLSKLWPFHRQADETDQVLRHLHEIHLHVDDMRVGGYLTEAERVLRIAVEALRAHEELT